LLLYRQIDWLLDIIYLKNELYSITNENYVKKLKISLRIEKLTKFGIYDYAEKIKTIGCFLLFK